MLGGCAGLAASGGGRLYAATPAFTDITAAAGLSSALNVSGSHTDKQFLLEEMGAPTTPREQRAARRLQVMREEIARIEQIVSSFLQYVRLQRIDGRPLDLNALLRRLLADNADGLDRAGIRVHFDPEEALPVPSETTVPLMTAGALLVAVIGLLVGWPLLILAGAVATVTCVAAWLSRAGAAS